MNIYRNNNSYDNYEVLVIFLTYEMIEGYFDSRARLFKAGLGVSVLSDFRSESLKGNFIIFKTEVKKPGLKFNLSSALIGP